MEAEIVITKSLEKTRMREFLSRLISASRTAAPVRQRGGYFKLSFVTSPEDVALDCKYLYYSAKPLVLPGIETLVKYGREKKLEFESVINVEPTILFGLHPCDINALWMMDAPFINSGERDVNYLKRREALTLIGVDCLAPCDEKCFCKDMKAHCVREGCNYDLLLRDVGKSYVVAVGSDKGAKLVDDLPAADAAELARVEALGREKESHFPSRIPYDTAELPHRLETHHESPLWERAARLCFSCGSCNLVCPTCYCFDVFDEIDLKLDSAARERKWDGCQLEQFAVVAGGENFRADRSERLRHRCLRKGKYILEKFGRPGCVGCGRCIRACTADISILEVFNQLIEDPTDGPKRDAE